MSDDLDELERVCKNNWRWPTYGEVLALIERCRRWPEAVAKVRALCGCNGKVVCDEITRLATEKRE